MHLCRVEQVRLIKPGSLWEIQSLPWDPGQGFCKVQLYKLYCSYIQTLCTMYKSVILMLCDSNNSKFTNSTEYIQFNNQMFFSHTLLRSANTIEMHILLVLVAASKNQVFQNLCACMNKNLSQSRKINHTSQRHCMLICVSLIMFNFS